VDTMIGRVGRRPRRRPPLRSYVPFAIFFATVVVFLLAVIWLLLRVVEPSNNNSSSLLPTASATPARAASQASVSPVPTDTAALPSQSPVSSMLTVGTAAIATPSVPSTPNPSGTAGPTPTTGKPAATATATNKASIVIARGVSKDHSPLESSTRFVSPASRLYAIVTVSHVKATDLLRFVFQRNDKTLPHDDIQYQAGTSVGKQTFAAFADYKNGSKPLPSGRYRVLFYRNGLLEAVTTFRVG
jgi:hypothetical protein